MKSVRKAINSYMAERIRKRRVKSLEQTYQRFNRKRSPDMIL